MSRELLAIVEQIEREKGIKKEVLIQAVESAILSAIKRVIDAKPDEELRVEINRTTGDISAFRNEEKIVSVDFGRIAASAARQVIIQKIREAEKDVVFNEFQAKVGEIVSGTVYRFEKGNIVVDLLGKAEALLLKSEQSLKDEFKQGHRVRAFILEVKKDNRGPQIILSRRHPSFVKKLFELEVPEIYDGIVEIKSISRQAGERTKIAVCSKDEKVDSVGACVGMRGGRVKNIVNELGGERIDVVRFSDDIKEYIKAALSPAEISEIKLNKENKRAEVIVADDQLSLAIGKHGQNVRLASKLIGWELDIRTKAQVLAEVEEKKKAEEEKAKLDVEKAEEEVKIEVKEIVKEKRKTKENKVKAKEKTVTLEELPGVGEKPLALLKKLGYKSLEDLAGAKIEEITKVKGIGKAKAEKIKEAARKAILR